LLFSVNYCHAKNVATGVFPRIAVTWGVYVCVSVCVCVCVCARVCAYIPRAHAHTHTYIEGMLGPHMFL